MKYTTILFDLDGTLTRSEMGITRSALYAAEKIHQEYVGKTLRCLVDGTDKDMLTARTEGGRLVRLPAGSAEIGNFIWVTITGSTTWSLTGIPAGKDE